MGMALEWEAGGGGGVEGKDEELDAGGGGVGQ